MNISYVIYKGDDVVIVGSSKECAAFLDVKETTIKFYASPIHWKRVAESSNPNARIIAEKVINV
jgi:hypothetical protein